MTDLTAANAADAADTEMTLSLGEFRLRVSPYGASLRGFWRESQDEDRDETAGPEEIVTVYSGKNGKVAGQGDTLVPFPGRVRAGRYMFEGKTYQMQAEDKDGPNAIHGFLRNRLWETTDQTHRSVTFSTDLAADAAPGYPFALRTEITYTLRDNGMTESFTITNIGNTNAPVAAGFHPYFSVGSAFIDADLLQVPMDATLDFVNLLPTGKILPVEGTPFDFRSPRPIGDLPLNTCYLQPSRDPDGLLRIRLAAPDDSRTLTVWMDAAFDYVVLFSADPMPNIARRCLAIEPMTCASDGFNFPEWGLKKLAPGESFSGSWGVYATFGAVPDGV